MPFLANSGILSHLGEAFSVNTLLFVLVSLFMYVVLAAFLGSMVSRPEDAGKALSPLMILIIAGFVGVTALGAAGDNFDFENRFLYSFHLNLLYAFQSY